MNALKIALLMTGMTMLFLVAGRALGGESGMVLALVMAAGANLSAYWFSDRMVLMMSGAKEVTRAQAPRLFEMVEGLAQRARLPMPRLYVMPEASPNAFATGRDPRHAAVAVTEGIMDLLSPRELQGVLAHELAHIKNRDILVAAIAATMAGAVAMLANVAQWGMLSGGRGHDSDREGGHPFAAMAAMILAPLAAMLIQLAISRSREYLADAEGALIHDDPLDLACALRKLEQAGRRTHMDVQPAAAHLFIVNPLRGEGLISLFSTHPPMKERIKRLESLARA